MKNLLFTLGLCLSLHQIQAQNTVNFTGQIKNTKPDDSISLVFERSYLPLEIMEDGTFSVDKVIEQKTSYLYFAKISKRGKLERQTPLIWFEGNEVIVTIDLTDQSFQIENFMTFQSTSEKIEASKRSEQIELILKNPNEIPSLYFADKLKEKFSSSDLEKYINSLSVESKNSVYAKRIESYLLALNRPALKKGKPVENFKLPNEKDEYIDVICQNNKPQVIAMFSSDCAYSIASINLLEQLTELDNGKIEIVTIWDDKTKDIWLNSYKEEKSNITWTNLWDEYGFAKTYLNRKMWPTFYVLNENGELTKTLKGYDKKTAKALKKLIE